jgi:GTPase SAR1 family protein
MVEEVTSFKVVMLGEANVGKTCIVNHYLKNKFSGGNPSTIGSNFSSK